MKIQLAPSFVLSDEHPKSRNGVPVLVDRRGDQPFEDCDVYRASDVFQAYPSYGLQPAAHTVVRLWKSHQPSPYSNEERAAAQSFLSQWPEGPQLTSQEAKQ
jgi:hypothetical protein